MSGRRVPIVLDDGVYIFDIFAADPVFHPGWVHYDNGMRTSTHVTPCGIGAHTGTPFMPVVHALAFGRPCKTCYRPNTPAHRALEKVRRVIDGTPEPVDLPELAERPSLAGLPSWRVTLDGYNNGWVVVLDGDQIRVTSAIDEESYVYANLAELEQRLEPPNSCGTECQLGQCRGCVADRRMYEAVIETIRGASLAG
jgi:hypothetical protein